MKGTSMSDTPRTDYASEKLIGFPFKEGDHCFVDFTRQLERELAASRARVEVLEAALRKAILQNECDMILTGDELRQMRAALSQKNKHD